MTKINRRQALQGATAISVGAVTSVVTPTAQAQPIHPNQGTFRHDEGVSPAPDPENPLRLWYTAPAAEWLEALAIGNGRLGAMVFGGVEAERLQLNEDTIWGEGPHDYNDPSAHEVLPEIRKLINEDEWGAAQALADERFMGRPTEQAPYQTPGDLMINFPGLTGSVDYERDLDLEKAVATTRFSLGDVTYTREAFASHPDQVIVVRLTADQDAKINFDATFASPQRNTTRRFDDQTLALEGISSDANGIKGQVKFTMLVRAQTDGGAITVTSDQLSVAGANSTTLLISIGSSYRDHRDVGADHLARATKPLVRTTRLPYPRLRARHIEDYRKLFGRVDLFLGTSESIKLPTNERVPLFKEGKDPQLAALYYQFGRYLLISSSRTPGQPANLQGIWNDSLAPAWESKYTLNINAEMNYWPAGPANLAECWEPLFAMTAELAESGARTARAMYDTDGWVAHHNTDAWRGTAPVDFAYYGVWPMGGAWLSLLFWEHYQYTGDLEMLRKYYPTMKGCITFFLANLQRDERTGWLVTNPSHSPEVRHFEDPVVGGVSLCSGPTMDQQILRDLFDAFGSAAGLLGVDAAMAEQVAESRAQLAPMQIGYLGQLQEWLIDWKEAALESSRHVSHLWGLFPSDQITALGTPELADAARKSLELRGPAVTAGWSLAWKLNLRTRLLEPDHAYLHLTQLINSGRTAPNLFDLHPPFQIDGNFGGLSGISEMLVQGHSGEIALLPCLPTAWPTGRLRGFRARGGFEIALEWEVGSLVHAEIRSLLGNPVRLRTAGSITVSAANGPVQTSSNDDGTISFETVADEVYEVQAS